MKDSYSFGDNFPDFDVFPFLAAFSLLLDLLCLLPLELGLLGIFYHPFSPAEEKHAWVRVQLLTVEAVLAVGLEVGQLGQGLAAGIKIL